LFCRGGQSIFLLSDSNIRTKFARHNSIGDFHMALLDKNFMQAGTATQSTASVDQGLRSYMLRVYNYMAAGVAVSGIAAYATVVAATGGEVGRAGRAALTPFGQMLYSSPVKYIVMFAPLAFILLFSFRAYKMSVAGAQMAFWSFATIMGVSLSSILLIFKVGSITSVFFTTSAAFAALSLYGYTTKKDLSGWGTFLIMGVLGLIIASVVNIFLQSSALQFAVSALGVLIFAGLTAYDTQQIKDGYYAVFHDATAASKGAIMGALTLYLDFINMFTSMLNIFGDRD
jgi:uncharacterized protein